MGYTTTACAKDTWYLVSSQFETTDGAQEVSIQDVIANLSDLTPGSGTTAPCIMRWTGSSYANYYYLAEAENDDGDPVENVWARAGTQTTDKLKLADGFFFKTPNACSITVAGQVVAANAKDVVIKPNIWNLVANPFPVPFVLNSAQVDWIHTFTPGSGTTAPCIMRWTGSSYANYYYLAEAENDDGDPVENVWARAGTETTDSIGIACGFFIKFAGDENKTIRFNK